MAVSSIDRDRLRAQVRMLDEGALLVFLDRAIDLLPETKLAKMVQGYLLPEPLDPEARQDSGLLAAARRFHAASLRGEFFEDFMVNSRNCTRKSRGTQIFIAECLRIVDLCVAAARKHEYAEALAAIELIFDLLRRIDQCRDDIIFFADEGGSYEISIDWETVLPAWSRCLARLTSAPEYAQAVRKAARDFTFVGSGRLLACAHRAASREQRDALSR